MSYSHCVAATVCGSAKQIKKLVRKLEQIALPEEDKAWLAKFQTITLDEETTLFVYFAQWVTWSESEQALWDSIIQLAQRFKLDYSFQRVGDDYGDLECYYSSELYDYQELFSLRYELEPYHSKLIGRFD